MMEMEVEEEVEEEAEGGRSVSEVLDGWSVSDSVVRWVMDWVVDYDVGDAAMNKESEGAAESIPRVQQGVGSETIDSERAKPKMA